MKKTISLILFLSCSISYASNFIVHIPKNKAVYTDESFIEKSDMDENDIPWKKTTFDLTNYHPSIVDGSSAGQALFIFNFGQEKFKKTVKGFNPYDPDYDESNWVGAAQTTVAGYLGNLSITKNLAGAYYNKKRKSGKYYFEVQINRLGALDALGMINPDYGTTFYHSIGVRDVGTYSSGLKWISGTGSSVTEFYNLDVTQTHGEIFQVFINYDENKIAVMQLNTKKEDYINYLD